MENLPARMLDAINIIHLIVTLNVTFYSVFNKALSLDCKYIWAYIFPVFKYQLPLIFECFANKVFVPCLFNQQFSPNSNLLNCIACQIEINSDVL